MHSLPRNVVALMRKDGRQGSEGGFFFRIGSSRSSSELSLSELFSMIIVRFARLLPYFASVAAFALKFLLTVRVLSLAALGGMGLSALRGITSVFSFFRLFC